VDMESERFAPTAETVEPEAGEGTHA
jgi:hypothetical protein